MSWSKELVILSSYSLIYVNLKKLQNGCNFQVNCSSSHHLWTKKDVLSKRYSVPDAQLLVSWPFLKFLKFCILADTPSAVLWYRSSWVLETISVGMLFPSVCEDPLRLTALHTIQEKEILAHWKDPAGLSLVLLFPALAGCKGQEPDCVNECVDECVQLVTVLLRVVKSGIRPANLQQRLVFLSLEETSFASIQ